MTDTHPRPASTIRIGRQPDNDITLGALDVSRHHAELRRNPSGGFEIVDLGSHSGIYVNGERITSKVLTEQDIINIGHTTFRLSDGELRQYADERPGRLPARASAHDVVAGYWAAAEARDWEAFGALLADVDLKGREPARLFSGSSEPDVEELRSVLYGPDAPADAPLSLDWGFLSLFPERATQAEYQKHLKALEEWLGKGPPRAICGYESRWFVSMIGPGGCPGAARKP